MTKCLFDAPVSKIIPRDYQREDLENSFRLWDAGTVGVLTRAATGLGKTLMSCLKAERWLARSPSNRIMVLSYENELVDQFAQEVEDVLGITPGIEMGKAEVPPGDIPRIVVASRQSLATRELATSEQREALASLGLKEIGLLTKQAAQSAISVLRKGGDIQAVADGIEAHNEDYRCNRQMKRVSRLYKFDWRDNWLLILDEAHKYSMKLKTVGHVIEWFDQNPASRRSGITATPKRRDNVSIGTTLFPGISIDYPLTRAVAEGYSVPYRQKFVQVESIDFKRLKEACAGNQEKWDAELDALLNTEETLAKLCEPMLDMVGERKTLIFSPSVAMAKNVADYINARSEVECPSCATRRWYPNLLIGDGAKCKECGDFLTKANVTKCGVQAHSLSGEIPHKSRKEVYRGHKENRFQFLSICGLCLAKGTLVLTDQGEIPIEHVTTSMKLWDGVEFVAHDGVICKGVKPVIEYAGLTATEDHNVWTVFGWERFAACKQQGIAIRVSGIGGKAVRESCGYYRGDRSLWRESPGWLGSAVRWLRKTLHQGIQRTQDRPGWMQELREAIRRSWMAVDAVPLRKEAVRESERRVLFRLWWAWNQVPICFADSNGTMDHGAYWTAQGIDAGQRGKQQALRTGQSSVGQSNGAGKQQEAATARLSSAEVFDIINAGPRHRFTANGLIVSNCREGYNDQQISAVAIFRPVSKAASSLAEQMKGRASRTERGCIDGLNTREERLAAIASSGKPDALVVDLVGVTGLADCASTIQIYAEGQPDDIVARAEEIALRGGVEDPLEAIEQAKQEAKEEQERSRLQREADAKARREAAEQRAKLDAEVKYSTHDVGTSPSSGERDPAMASEGQLRFLHMLGIDFCGWEPSKRQAGRMISQLKEEGLPLEEVIRTNRVPEGHWKKAGPTVKQIQALARRGINAQGMTPAQASAAFEGKKPAEPPPQHGDFAKNVLADLSRAETHDVLDVLRDTIIAARKGGLLNETEYAAVKTKGQEQRAKVF